MVTTLISNNSKKNIAFTGQHKFDDVAEEYMSAIYRFRKAESEMSDDYNESRREMNRLEQSLQWVRHCIYNKSVHLLFDSPGFTPQSNRCPSPDWI